MSGGGHSMGTVYGDKRERVGWEKWVVRGAQRGGKCMRDSQMLVNVCSCLVRDWLW